MLLRIPDFYDSFHCLGSACPDNCCIGGELVIDDDTLTYYKSVEGPFGDRLRAKLSADVTISNKKEISTPEWEFRSKDPSDEENMNFRLKVGGRCPFLNDNNLCEISLELGPDALCSVCTDYPRYSFEWGNIIEKSLTLSCPEAGRLLFLNDIPVRFKEIPLSGDGLDAYMDFEQYGEMGSEEEPLKQEAPVPLKPEDHNSMEPENDITMEPKDQVPIEPEVHVLMEPEDEWEQDPDFDFYQDIERIRSECIQILQNRTLPLEKRIALFLRRCNETGKYAALCDDTGPFARNVSDGIGPYSVYFNDGTGAFPENEAGIDIAPAPTGVTPPPGKRLTETSCSQCIAPAPAGATIPPLRDDREGFAHRLEILAGMEVLSERWASVMNDLSETLASKGSDYEAILQAYLSSEDYRKYAYTYEHLLVYFTFRYFPLVADGFDLEEIAHFVIFACRVIRDLDAVVYHRKKSFSFSDRIRTASDFSKQVELSDYNIEYLIKNIR